MLVLGFATLGSRRRAQFEAAPETLQRAFWKRLRAEQEAQRELVYSTLEMNADPTAPLPPAPLPEVDHRLVGWDESWQRRARAIRKAELAPEDDWTPNRDDDPLRDIPAVVFVEALTGEAVPPSRSMRCVLPDHDDLHPSFRVYDTGWRCFGCGKSGTIYDLASVLWGVEPRGRGFVELHKRLRAVFA